MGAYSDTKIESSFFTKYGFLICPIIEHIERNEQVCIIPYGFFGDIPFHALKYNDKTLIEFNPVVYNASISSWLYLHSHSIIEKRSGIVSIMGDPQNNLKGAKEESVYLAKLMQVKLIEGKDVSKKMFLSQLSKSQLFHYSGHCYVTRVDERLPEINYSDFQLVLDHDSITLEDVVKTKNHADLVVLSACDTGLHSHYIGQELLGFPTAFLLAGSQSIISSMWPVDDESTTKFFQVFYKKIVKGKSKMQALRETMVEGMASHDCPYHWCAFMLWGLGGDMPTKGFGT